MLTAGVQAREKYGADYAISGKDGVHPGWAGHTLMAYAFLKAFGLDGEIGEFTVDLKSNKMKASKGHEVVSSKDGEFQIKSSRYPFAHVFQRPMARLLIRCAAATMRIRIAAFARE